MRAPGPPPAAHRPRHGGSALPRRGREMLAMLLLLPVLTSAAWASATATRIELQLVGMDCGLCVHGLEQRLRSLPGTQQVQLDLEHGRLSLLLGAGSSVADQTLHSLLRDAGFLVRQIRRSPVTP